jgi:hypothetical protein
MPTAASSVCFHDCSIQLVILTRSVNVVHNQDYDLDLYIRQGSQVPDRFTNYDYKDSGLKYA